VGERLIETVEVAVRETVTLAVDVGVKEILDVIEPVTDEVAVDVGVILINGEDEELVDIETDGVGTVTY